MIRNRVLISLICPRFRPAASPQVQHQGSHGTCWTERRPPWKRFVPEPRPPRRQRPGSGRAAKTTAASPELAGMYSDWSMVQEWCQIFKRGMTTEPFGCKYCSGVHPESISNLKKSAFQPRRHGGYGSVRGLLTFKAGTALEGM